MRGKKLFSILLVVAMIFSSFMASFAATGDVTKISDGQIILAADYLLDEDTFLEIASNLDQYLIEVDGKLYKASEVQAKFDDGTATNLQDAIVGLTEQPNPGSTLKVVSVSAINKTTIKVEFSKAVDAVAASNFTVKVGEAVKVIDTVVLNAPDNNIATLTVQGLNYEDNVTVMVTGIKAGAETLADTTKSFNVPALGDLYELKITCDAENNTIKSDGATKTMLTAELIEKATNTVVALDGVVQFLATKGGLAQTEVTLEDGKASVQLTSLASDSSIVSNISVTVVDAPSATEYEGLIGQFQVTFAPDGTTPGTTTFVSLRTAESTQGDRFFVSFSDDITVAEFKEAAIATTGAANWTAAGLAGAGLTIDGAAPAIVDVIQKSSTSLEFILATDTTGSIAPTTTQIRTAWAAATPNYLRDNDTHTLGIPANIGEKVLANTTGVSFIMTDNKRPFIYGVEVDDQVNFHVRFSESMAEDLVETVAVGGAAVNVATPFTSGMAGHNDKFLIDGKRVYLTNVATGATAGEKAFAAANNLVLVNRLYVGAYNNVSGEDTRSNVYFALDRASTLGSGSHQIQIANIGDWAAIVDPVNNMVSTQTLDFDVDPDLTKPTVTLEVQSPEQMLLTFSEDVTVPAASGKVVNDAFEFYLKNGTTKLVQGVDYTITPINEDGRAIAATLNVTTPTRYFLVEMVRDWTKYYNTAANPNDNYWASTSNPYVFKVAFFEDALSNVMDAKTLNPVLELDVVSPTIADAVDVVTLPGQTKNGVPVTNSGQAVFVTMSEPVNIPGPTPALAPAGTAGGTENYTTPYNENQDQDLSTDNGTTVEISMPTFEFIKGDSVISGTLAPSSVYEDDYDFVITPATPLTPGQWTLYIKSITDEVGNASATTSYVVTVPETTPVVSDTKIAWVGFDNSATAFTGKDYLYVKFTKAMNPAGAAGVFRTTNYVFNGVALPAGSQVYRGISGVTNDWDGVTIEMPGDAFLPLAAAGATDGTSVLNVANNFKAADGTALSGPYEVQLADRTGNSTADKDSFPDTGIVVATNLEAFYCNTAASTTITGKGAGGLSSVVMTATAAEAVGVNGKIDQITVTLESTITTNGTEVIYYDGKAFTNTTAGANATQTFQLATDDLAINTSTVGKSLTSQGGGIMTNVVIDGAAPVLAKAEITTPGATPGFGNDVGDVITLTFSEYVNTNFATAAAPLFAEINGNFTVTTTGTNASLAFTNATFSANDLSVATGAASNVLVITVVTADTGSGLIIGGAAPNNATINGATVATSPTDLVSVPQKVVPTATPIPVQ